MSGTSTCFLSSAKAQVAALELASSAARCYSRRQSKRFSERDHLFENTFQSNGERSSFLQITYIFKRTWGVSVGRKLCGRALGE